MLRNWQAAGFALSQGMSSSSAASPSDRWSLESWFPAFQAPDYLAFKVALPGEVQTVKKAAEAIGNDLVALARVILDFESLGVRVGHLSAYLGCLSADDATNEAVTADKAWIAGVDAEYVKLRAALMGALAALSEGALDKLLADPRLAGAGYAVRRLREEGRRQMQVALEGLAADLNVDGLHAWGRLYDTLTGQMRFEMLFPDGHIETVPMSRRRALMAEPNRKLRAAAFDCGQKPWEEHAVTLAAALNGIAGTRLKLYDRRGIAHFLETPLFDSALSASSLEAMLEAIRQEIELPHRALRKAAALQGTPALHYYDLEAPQIAAPESMALDWAQACETVRKSFGAAYPKLGAYFQEMLERRWIEAQPRPGKRPGAFCTGSHLCHEERVYMTYYGTVHDMVTLAHETGHAWHGRVMGGMRPLATNYPMTLAETASNFGEMILLDGLMSDPAITPETKAYLLDQEMLRAHAYLINIPMRFEFERAFYNERAAGEVAVSRLRELMTDAQRLWYGNTLLGDGADPMFWASKMHFFISALSFYNFPYTVGYLLSQALYSRFKSEGAAFLPRYEAFLAATGSADCEGVVRETLDADLTDVEFWRVAVRGIKPGVEAYEKLG
jgi:oligoendopeptidase F